MGRATRGSTFRRWGRSREGAAQRLLGLLWCSQGSHVDVKAEPYRRLSAEEVMLLNCGVGEDS